MYFYVLLQYKLHYSPIQCTIILTSLSLLLTFKSANTDSSLHAHAPGTDFFSRPVIWRQPSHEPLHELKVVVFLSFQRAVVAKDRKNPFCGLCCDLNLSSSRRSCGRRRKMRLVFCSLLVFAFFFAANAQPSGWSYSVPLSIPATNESFSFYAVELSLDAEYLISQCKFSSFFLLFPLSNEKMRCFLFFPCVKLKFQSIFALSCFLIVNFLFSQLKWGPIVAIWSLAPIPTGIHL